MKLREAVPYAIAAIACAWALALAADWLAHATMGLFA
jgi:hypothetical protein